MVSGGVPIDTGSRLSYTLVLIEDLHLHSEPHAASQAKE
jgi:hypothetical protein